MILKIKFVCIKQQGLGHSFYCHVFLFHVFVLRILPKQKQLVSENRFYGFYILLTAPLWMSGNCCYWFNNSSSFLIALFFQATAGLTIDRNGLLYFIHYSSFDSYAFHLDCKVNADCGSKVLAQHYFSSFS